jgi:hypothetical protein
MDITSERASLNNLILSVSPFSFFIYSILGKAAEIYLIDEPSAYLDSEQRIVCAKVFFFPKVFFKS